MGKSVSFINRVFNLRPGDFGKALPLFFYYLLIVTFYMMARVVRDSIFLAHFRKDQLPYADLSIALVAAIVVAPYIRAGYRASLHNLQIGSLLFFTLNLLVFWWGLHFYQTTWVAAVFYVWVGICGILTVAQVWTLANFVWTTREAKRLFALLGSGGIIGGSLGGFLAKWIALTLGTDATLLFMAGFLALCTVLIRFIWSQKPSDRDENGSSVSGETPRTLSESFRLVRQSPHLMAIAALICLSSLATAVGSWQLKAFAKDVLGQKDAVTAYLGAVAGYTGLLSLVVQLLITTKLLRHFGVGVALLVLPHLTQPATADLAQLYFEVWYLKLAGLYPAHRRCHQCQASLGDEDAVFVGIGRHLFACGRCQTGNRRVSLGALTLLDAIGGSHLASLFRSDFTSEDVIELRAIAEFLLQQSFERSFRSLKLISQQT